MDCRLSVLSTGPWICGSRANCKLQSQSFSISIRLHSPRTAVSHLGPRRVAAMPGTPRCILASLSTHPPSGPALSAARPCADNGQSPASKPVAEPLLCLSCPCPNSSAESALCPAAAARQFTAINYTPIPRTPTQPTKFGDRDIYYTTITTYTCTVHKAAQSTRRPTNCHQSTTKIHNAIISHMPHCHGLALNLDSRTQELHIMRSIQPLASHALPHRTTAMLRKTLA